MSPNGEWIAYQSDESGQYQLYVHPFPDVESNRFPITTAGGLNPAWARSGQELYYQERGRIMAVPVQTDQAFAWETPEALFPTDGYYLRRGQRGRAYDVAQDGRFLMIKPGTADGGATLPEINVVLNWLEELKERVPVP